MIESLPIMADGNRFTVLIFYCRCLNQDPKDMSWGNLRVIQGEKNGCWKWIRITFAPRHGDRQLCGAHRKQPGRQSPIFSNLAATEQHRIRWLATCKSVFLMLRKPTYCHWCINRGQEGLVYLNADIRIYAGVPL